MPIPVARTILFLPVLELGLHGIMWHVPSCLQLGAPGPSLPGWHCRYEPADVPICSARICVSAVWDLGDGAGAAPVGGVRMAPPLLEGPQSPVQPSWLGNYLSR